MSSDDTYHPLTINDNEDISITPQWPPYAPPQRLCGAEMLGWGVSQRALVNDNRMVPRTAGLVSGEISRCTQLQP